MQNRAGSLSIFAVLSCSTVFGASVTLGSANDGNCYPFNCNDSGSSSGQSIEYQQVFDGTQFGSSPVTITGMTFFDQFLPGFGFSNVPLLAGSYTFSLAVTSAAIGNLSTTLGNNITSGEATFLVDTSDPGLAAPFDSISVTGTPYVYNPASGNLLLDIVVTDQDNVSSASYSPANGFDADDTGTSTSRAYSINGSSAADSSGLVTEFTYTSSAVPEPGTYLLIGAGLLLLAGSKKRKGAIALAAMLAFGLMISTTASAQQQPIQGRSIVIPVHTLGGGKAAIPQIEAIVSVPLWSRNYTIADVAYPVTFVGTDPALNNSTTTITVPVVPIIIVVNNLQNQAQAFDPTKKLNTAPPGSALSALLSTLTSPLFQTATYNLSGTVVGTGVQFGDAVQRANWWANVSTTSPNWHTVLKYQLEPAVTLNAPAPVSGDPTVTGPFAEVDNSWLTPQLDALSGNYGGPTTFPLFILYEVLQTDDNGGCCILGYHSAVQNDNNIQTYGMGSYFDPFQVGPSISDITDISHEVAEWLNDPFGNNTVPAWPAPFSFIVPGPPYTPGECQNNLEVGDPLEDRSHFSFPVTTMGRTYNPQNVALVPWFMQQSPSPAVNGWYTFQGPIDSEFSAPAPACPQGPPTGIAQ